MRNRTNSSPNLTYFFENFFKEPELQASDLMLFHSLITPEFKLMVSTLQFPKQLGRCIENYKAVLTQKEIKVAKFHLLSMGKYYKNY